MDNMAKTYSTTHNPLGNITVTAGGSGYSSTSGSAIYMGGFGGSSTGSAPTWTMASSATTAATMSPGALQVKGDSEFQGSVKVKGDSEFQGNVTVKGIRVKGRDLTDWIETVDSRLGLLHIDAALETEFDELRALGDAYREAERRFNEQKRVYEILKNTDE